MATELEPIIGNWYRHLDKGQSFRVVAVDEDNGLIEVQHFDGDLEQIELGAWADQDLELSEEPEDWTGPVDDIEADDLDYSETDMQETDWRQSLQEGRASGEEAWEDTEAEQALDREEPAEPTDLDEDELDEG